MLRGFLVSGLLCLCLSACQVDPDYDDVDEIADAGSMRDAQLDSGRSSTTDAEVKRDASFEDEGDAGTDDDDGGTSGASGALDLGYGIVCSAQSSERECTGRDAAAECASNCLAPCTGQCSDYMACLKDGADETMQLGANCERRKQCAIEPSCEQCLTAYALCTIPCANMVVCEDEIETPHCDELDACCLGLSGETQAQCMQEASVARSLDADGPCMLLMNTYCP